ncbi:MAG TPA: rhodanese-like domain-containing protein [Acidimicrobiales bacterium]|nr:rhodanese-like domain-containing protein [Acidimicrobiales bacterium]
MSGTVTTRQRLEIVSYDAQGLGDRSYLLHDGGKAVVVDPQRDPGPYLTTAEGLGVDITLVLETHIHNDYVSGGLALARRAKATYAVPSGEPVEFAADCQALDDGDVLTAGHLSVRVLSTPGHTPHHLSFLIEDALGTKVVMTGGSLLVGTTGRTDLFGPGATRSLAEAQWRSVRRLLADLSPSTVVLPTHGFGSFCSVGPVEASAVAEATIGRERQRNPVAQLELADFIDALANQSLPVPAYYRHMAPRNRAGAPEPRYERLPLVAPEALPGLIGRGDFVVDIRSRRDFAGGHLRRSMNIELGPNLSTYLGWLVPIEDDFVLLGPTPGEVGEARRLLARIGREKAKGWAQADVLASLAENQCRSYEVRDFSDLGERSKDGSFPNVLDVRFPYEWEKGHIRGARNVPLPEIGVIAPSLSRREEIWVHCSAGYRAAIAASMLSGEGLVPVLVDDLFDHASDAGLEIVPQ